MATAMEALEKATLEATQLRDVSDLLAGTDELREAAVTGNLVARIPVKLAMPDGIQRFQPGDRLPPIEPTHRLIAAEEHPLTTLERWDAKQKYTEVADVLVSVKPIRTRIRQAEARMDKARVAVANAKATLSAAMDELKDAEREVKAADDQLIKALKVK